MSVLKSPRVKATLAVVGSLFVGGSVLLPPEVYSSWWWFVLWTVAGLLLVALLAGKRMRGRKALWCFHLSLLLILAGGGVTALTAERGTLRLSPGEHSDVYYDSDSLALPLPVGVRLEKFEVVYYPGMTFPRDFRSVIVTDGGERIVISMNRIGHLSAPGRSWDDYRLYQTSYDSTGATVLTVAHDPFGIALTYAGYALFALAGLLMLVGKSFRRPVRGVTVMALMVLAGTGRGEAAPAVPQSLADSLAGKQVLFRGHAVPFESMARKLTLALTGSEKVGGMDATRFIASLTVYPDEWRDVGFLFVKDKGLSKALELKGAYVSPAALYSVDGRYIPETLWRDGSGELDRAILRLDEKVALLAELWSGKLYSPLPTDSELRLSDEEVMLVLAYDRCRPGMIFFICAFIVGVLSLAAGNRCRKMRLWGGVALTLFGLMTFAWHWAASGEAPLVGSSDLLFFTAVMLSGLCIWVGRKDVLLGSCGLLATGALALVAWLGSRTPQLTPLMPVLASPWLSVHVSVVMTSYALLGFASLGGLIGLMRPAGLERLMPTALRLTEWGVWLLGLGIWLGAVWANVSWGRYWAWDPKETWALVTMLIYAVPLHRSTGLRGRSLAIYLLLASLAMLMTYSGVNFLSSLHSYRV